MLIRQVQRASLILGAVVAALLFFLGGSAMRLLMGPISLGPFAAIIEDALNDSVAGVVIRFDQAVLEWSRDEGRVNIVVLGTRVLDSSGRIIAQAPKADVDFDAVALVAGKLSLKRFALLGVQLTGVRAMDGHIRLGFGPEQDEPNLFESIRKILESSDQGGGSLESFSLRHARLAFRDEPSGLFVVSPDTDFTLKHNGDSFDAELDSAVEIAGTAGHVTAHAQLNSDGTPRQGSVDIKNLSFPALTRVSERFAALKPYQLISDVAADFVIDDQGELKTAGFRVAGSGDIDDSVLGSPLKLEKYALAGSYDVEKSRLVLDSVSLESQPVAGTAKAVLDFAWAGETLEMVTGSLSSTKLRLDMPALLRQPMNLSQLSLQASYSPATKEFSWQRGSLTSEELSANLEGSIRMEEGSVPSVKLTGSIGPLSVADALRFWPLRIGEGARSWIEANIPEGVVGPLQVDADIAAGALAALPLPDDSITLSFPFSDVTARYIEGMTPLSGGSGEAKLTGDTFHVMVQAAAIGPLAISDGDLYIPDLHTPGVLSRIKAQGEGTTADVMRLIDQDPLNYPRRFHIDPAMVEGRAAVDLQFDLPLVRALTLDQVKISIRAEVTDLGLPIKGRKLEHGLARAVIDNKSLKSDGTATLSGVPVEFTWSEDFTAPADTTHVELVGKLDDESRAQLGWSEPRWVTGPMPVSLALVGRRFDFHDAAVQADLTGTLAELPAISFVKRPGTGATATATLRFGENNAIFVDDMVVTGADFAARGTVSLGDQGRFLKASISHMEAGENDFAIDVVPMADGVLSFSIDGKSLDATHYSPKKKPSGSKQPTAAQAQDEAITPFALRARVDRLVLNDEAVFQSANVALGFAANDKLTEFELDTAGIGKGRIRGQMKSVDGVRSLALDADDAGAFIHTFMGFSSVRDGHLSAQVAFPIDTWRPGPTALPPDYQGTLVLSDITVTDQPFIARLFSAGSLAGPLRLLQGEGIPLQSVNAPFSARGKMLSIRDGRASGPAIGATFGGTLDRGAERVDLTGSLVPVFGLNSILGSVPILGNLLISKQGEGVFGITYAMKGNLNEPEIALNPLSVLTPGIFRRIFEFATPKESAPAAPLQPPVVDKSQAPALLPE